MSKRNAAARRGSGQGAPAAAPNLRALIELERQGRSQKCAAEIDAVLKRYNCQLQAQTLISGGQVESRVLILPLDPPAPAAAPVAPAGGAT